MNSSLHIVYYLSVDRRGCSTDWLAYNHKVVMLVLLCHDVEVDWAGHFAVEMILISDLWWTIYLMAILGFLNICIHMFVIFDANICHYIGPTQQNRLVTTGILNLIDFNSLMLLYDRWRVWWERTCSAVMIFSCYRILWTVCLVCFL